MDGLHCPLQQSPTGKVATLPTPAVYNVCMATRNGDKAVTIHDVALESKVSIATVSYVINNGPRNVKAETRERVQAVIERLRYRPNALARSLVARKTEIIGLISNKFPGRLLINNPYSLGIVDGALTAAESHGYNVIVFTQVWQNREESEAWVLERKTDGLLVIAPSVDTDMIKTLEEMHVPLVGVGVEAERLGIPSVDIDNREGARLATEHLLSLGHKRIAHLGGTISQISAQRRRDAFIDTMANAGIAVPPEYIINTGYEAIDAARDTERLLSLPEPPTAIFAANDFIASRAILTAEQHGYTVPDTLSVVGYDNNPISDAVHRLMTTIHQPVVEIGRRATELLIRQIDGETVEVKTEMLAPTLVVRGTTGPVVGPLIR